MATQGLQFMAFDLHVHTPASRDYKMMDAKPKDIVAAALDAGLDAICITDHNTADWVDKVAEAAAGTDLTVFPGVELSTGSGKSGPIHVVGIWAPGTPRGAIEDVFSPIGLGFQDRGRLDWCSTKSTMDVIEYIADKHGIPVLAHCDSSHGVAKDMRGQPRIELFRCPRLMAAETINGEVTRLLDGTDPNYRRKLATYEVSDAHCPMEIGTRKHYFRVASPTLGGLKLCFLDPVKRIWSVEDYENARIAHPQIVQLDISKGFFEGQSVGFHSCQSSIIGGQGVGKSLIVEFIRFALHQQSKLDDISKDSVSKLSNRLGLGGRVTLLVRSEAGTSYRITRTFDGDENPTEVVCTDTGEMYRGDVARLFPIIAYSQTETVHISRHPNAQRELIDGLIGAADLLKDIDADRDSLDKLDARVALAFDAEQALRNISKEIATKQADLAEKEKILSSEVLAEKKRLDSIDSQFIGEADKLEKANNSLVAAKEAIEGLARLANPGNEEALEEAVVDGVAAHQENQTSLLLAARQETDSFLSSANTSLAALTEALETHRAHVVALHEQWLPGLEEATAAYERFLSQAGGDLKKTAVERDSLLKQLKSLEGKRIEQQKLAEELLTLQEQREAILDDLDSKRETLYRARAAEYERLTEASEGRLQLTIQQDGDREPFTEALASIGVGSRLHRPVYQALATSIRPREFISRVLAEDAEWIANASSLEVDQVRKIIGHLLLRDPITDLLALDHNCLPQDLPTIKFQKADDNYYPISEVSTGQRCTALLIIALCASNRPVIVDQPEESIDIAAVVGDVVEKLRDAKQSRQFILTTHNPNIAVTADSDLIHVLEASSDVGHIAQSGVIEEQPICTELINHLEGGPVPYMIRGQKYGLLGPAQGHQLPSESR